MEKSFQLDHREIAALQQFDQARTQALAMVGALTLDMEQAKKNLETAQEGQRAFIRQALAIRDVDRYENARAANGTLLVTLPDDALAEMPPPVGAISRKEPLRVNGPIGTE